jgi:predicted RNA binding protein YcfA (HicA-like mRNA interferase family)
MLALPHLSGSECIAILLQLGFRSHRRAGAMATLRRGVSVVIVPETATLGPAHVAAILRAAAIDPLDFLGAFEARGPTPSAPASAVA